jgi:hypothetical protein
MHEEPTTVIILRYLDALPGDTAAEPIVREHLERSASRTREAVPLLVTASAANPKDTLLSLKVATLQGWSGQDREFAAKACSILPSPDKAELEAALALARTAVKVGKGTEWWDRYVLALGMAKYRGGNYAAADEALLAAEKAGRPTAT